MTAGENRGEVRGLGGVEGTLEWRRGSGESREVGLVLMLSD